MLFLILFDKLNGMDPIRFELTKVSHIIWAQGGEVPVTEMLGTFALSVGAAVSVAVCSKLEDKNLCLESEKKTKVMD